MFAEVSAWTEFIRVFTKDGAVMLVVPDVGYAYSASRNEHAFVPVVLSRSMS